VRTLHIRAPEIQRYAPLEAHFSDAVPDCCACASSHGFEERVHHKLDLQLSVLRSRHRRQRFQPLLLPRMVHQRSVAPKILLAMQHTSLEHVIKFVVVWLPLGRTFAHLRLNLVLCAEGVNGWSKVP